jgi:hypothetical protein
MNARVAMVCFHAGLVIRVRPRSTCSIELQGVGFSNFGFYKLDMTRIMCARRRGRTFRTLVGDDNWRADVVAIGQSVRWWIAAYRHAELA